MRDRLLRLVDTLRWPSSGRNGEGGGQGEAVVVEEWAVVEIVEACGALVEVVARHAPLAAEVAELNGVQVRVWPLFQSLFRSPLVHFGLISGLNLVVHRACYGCSMAVFRKHVWSTPPLAHSVSSAPSIRRLSQWSQRRGRAICLSLRTNARWIYSREYTINPPFASG